MLLVYESSEGVKIHFNREPENRIMKIGNLRDYSRPYRVVGKSITFQQNSPIERDLEISCLPAGDVTADKNFIISTFERDCQKGKFGKLYIGNNYLLCNIYAQQFEPESEVKGIFHTKCKLISKWGWFSDLAFEFFGKRTEEYQDSEIRDLPFDLHKPNITEYTLNNQNAIIDSAALIVFETVGNTTIEAPSITIGSNVYRVNAQINENYKITINPIYRTVTRINKTTGAEDNIFHLRDTASSVFAAVPSGILQVTVEDNVKATVNLLQERVTPLWI